MKKFYFALDTVLSYKEQVLENLQNEHARIMAEIVQCEKGIERLEGEQRECMDSFEEKKLQGIGINEMQVFDRFLISLRKKIQRERERLAEIRIREEKKREARKETASITKLKEKKLDQYNKEVQKEEEHFIDEFVSNKRAVERARNTA